jgi:hypothetical protein
VLSVDQPPGGGLLELELGEWKAEPLRSGGDCSELSEDLVASGECVLEFFLKPGELFVGRPDVEIDLAGELKEWLAAAAAAAVRNGHA